MTGRKFHKISSSNAEDETCRWTGTVSPVFICVNLSAQNARKIYEAEQICILLRIYDAFSYSLTLVFASKRVPQRQKCKKNEANKVSTSRIILLCHYCSGTNKIRTHRLQVGLMQITGISL